MVKMKLSNELISQFVKITNDKKETKKDSVIYGTVVDYNGKKYVRFDGGEDQLTPVISTSTLNVGDRVTIAVKNHSAIVTGNLTNPSTSNDIAISYITNVANSYSGDATLSNEEKENLVTFEDLVELFKNVDVEVLKVDHADIEDLKTNKLDAKTANITYANIDFTNIGSAAMEYLYSQSGLIENILIENGKITGTLIGVTIKGDLIEAGTLVADKLVVKGEDGLYYKLNTDGVTTEAEQTEYNSLNGSVITAKSITATQISVSDLVAFDATIGGFNITENSIYSEVKDSEGNTTRGIYMDTDGQMNFGDGSNFIKYYKAEDGTYKLAISAESIMYSLNGSQHDIADLGLLGEYVKIGTYEGEPCIELGEKDSDFKLLITNTRIQFMEGTSVPAYINNQALHITKAVVEEELQQGEFVWKVRNNGNMGLMWKGVDS